MCCVSPYTHSGFPSPVIPLFHSYATCPGLHPLSPVLHSLQSYAAYKPTVHPHFLLNCYIRQSVAPGPATLPVYSLTFLTNALLCRGYFTEFILCFWLLFGQLFLACSCFTLALVLPLLYVTACRLFTCKLTAPHILFLFPVHSELKRKPTCCLLKLCETCSC